MSSNPWEALDRIREGAIDRTRAPKAAALERDFGARNIRCSADGMWRAELVDRCTGERWTVCAGSFEQLGDAIRNDTRRLRGS